MSYNLVVSKELNYLVDCGSPGHASQLKDPSAILFGQVLAQVDGVLSLRKLLVVVIVSLGELVELNPSVANVLSLLLIEGRFAVSLVLEETRSLSTLSAVS